MCLRPVRAAGSAPTPRSSPRCGPGQVLGASSSSSRPRCVEVAGPGSAGRPVPERGWDRVLGLRCPVEVAAFINFPPRLGFQFPWLPFHLLTCGHSHKTFYLMIRLSSVVKCGIQILFSEPVGLRDGNSFACGVTRKGDPLHSCTVGEMRSEDYGMK